VPIYLGANNIENFIPKNAFIDFRDFISIEELHNYIYSMEEEEFLRYIINAKSFLNSDSSKIFDATYNANLIVEKILNL